jgi:hypothetical protein
MFFNDVSPLLKYPVTELRKKTSFIFQTLIAFITYSIPKMIRKFLLLPYLLSICCICFAQTSMRPVSLLDGNVTLQLPGTLPPFQQGTSRMLWKTAYPVTAISLTNNGENFLEYAYTDKRVDDNSIPAFTDELLSTFPVHKKYTKIVDDGIYLENGKNIGYLKVILKEKGDLQFHYFFYLSVDDRLLIFHFATPIKLRKAWEASIDAAAQSIKINQ